MSRVSPGVHNYIVTSRSFYSSRDPTDYFQLRIMAIKGEDVAIIAALPFYFAKIIRALITVPLLWQIIPEL